MRPWDQRDVSTRLQCYIQKGFGPAALGSARCAAPCPSPQIVGSCLHRYSAAERTVVKVKGYGAGQICKGPQKKFLRVKRCGGVRGGLAGGRPFRRARRKFKSMRIKSNSSKRCKCETSHANATEESRRSHSRCAGVASGKWVPRLSPHNSQHV